MGKVFDQGQSRRTEAVELRDAVTNLASKVDVAQRQTRLLRRLTWGVITLAVMAVVTAVIFASLLFQQVDQTRQSVTLLRDCVQSGGVCYQQQQARTAAVIGQIVDSNHNGVPDSKEILDAVKALQRPR